MDRIAIYKNNYTGETCRFNSIDKKGIVRMDYISGKTGYFVQEEKELEKNLQRNWTVFR